MTHLRAPSEHAATQCRLVLIGQSDCTRHRQPAAGRPKVVNFDEAETLLHMFDANLDEQTFWDDIKRKE
jgi:hypothetical protein